MSEFELPNDLSQWPSKPYELLGVKPGDNATDIKRAYTRLIRRFKPEHFPEHFRRLREAYDLINDLRAPSYENWERFERSTQAAGQGLAAEQVQNDPSKRRFARESNFERQETDPLKSLWRQAESGQINEVLERLRTAAWDDRQVGRVKLMEYWLTKLHHPDPSDSAAARILLSNLHHFETTIGLTSIARMELFSHPKLLDLIELQKCSLDAEIAFDILVAIRIRWEAAHRTLNFKLIHDDYNGLAERFFDLRDVRDGIAIQAANHLIWSQDAVNESKTRLIISELESMSGFRPFVSTSLERLEFALRLRSHLPNWTSRNTSSNIFETFVPWMWNDMDLDYPRATSDWLIASVNNPSEALEVFDFLNVAESLRIFLTHYFELVIRRYGFEVDDYEVDQQLKMDANDLSLPISQYSIDMLEVFFDAQVSMPYQRMRIAILEFCVGNHVSIEQIERYLKQSPSAYARIFRISLLEKLESDASLKSLTRLLLQLAVVTNMGETGPS